MYACRVIPLALLCAATSTNGFVTRDPAPRFGNPSSDALFALVEDSADSVDGFSGHRRSLLLSVVGSGMALSGFPTLATASNEDEESFASIAARAAQLSSEAGERTVAATPKSDDPRTAYDFSLPVAGETVPFRDIVRQSISEDGRAKVKAILVVNMKEDDPIARKDIPELISLASKYGRDGAFAIVMSPTDQGYYEPDTSQLIRLKLASEYGYGINPATVVTDKVNLLGTGAHPFWRWLQKTCRNPLGIGRIEGNYEKFLLDGKTGLPLRRYPRKYKPLDIKNDIEAVMAGKPIPPAGANYNEQWRAASVEAERDTYRFQKGLNYFDQQAD
mmetsp:Transcript_79037/g.228497  ORF Transcript_79037/g.228497 Transcript_79037/m.228497 type:complete len:332 (+) Transcript_79037:58-1053(+)